MSYFDALTLEAIVDELRDTVLGGRIQRVMLPNATSIALEVYASHRRFHVLLSAHPRFARVHMSSSKPTRGTSAVTPLLLLLRKYVNGGQIEAIDQPPLERMLLLSIVKRRAIRNSEADDEAAEPVDHLPSDQIEVLHSTLIAEIMDQRSNLILVDAQNSVLGVMRRVTHTMSRRTILPNEPYLPPPVQEKRDPRSITATGVLAAVLDAKPDQRGNPATLSRALVGAYRGLSPLAAREAIFRALGKPDAPVTEESDWAALASQVQAIWHADWQPCIAEEHGEPTSYAPFRLTHLAHVEAMPSMSATVERFYAAREQLTGHQQRRDQLAAQLGEGRTRYQRQQIALSTELEQARALDRLRWEGEMIYAFLHTTMPRQAELIVSDEQGQQQAIRLDPNKTAVENAQERFKAYEKSKSAIEGVPERLRAAELKLALYDETLALLEIADGYDAIEAIGREAAEQGLLGLQPTQRRKPGRVVSSPLRLESSDGLTIYVGRSAGQNDMVTFKLGSPDDMWLHVRGIPGAHVLIKSGGRPIPEQTIQEAAGLAAFHSRNRTEQAVEVDYARRSQVRKIRGGAPGLVSYHAEGSIRAAPRAPWK